MKFFKKKQEQKPPILKDTPTEISSLYFKDGNEWKHYDETTLNGGLKYIYGISTIKRI